MRVRAAVVHERVAGPVVADLDIDHPRPGEILVRMIASGISAADIAAIEGRLAMPLPFVPGCEGAGIVERVGEDVDHPKPGDAVLLTPGGASQGRALAGVRLDGTAPFHDGTRAINGFFHGQSSLATHVICPAVLAVVVGDGAPLELLAGLGREVLLGAGLVLQHLAHGDSESRTIAMLVVTGADAVGLGACLAAAAVGIETIVVADPREDRRALALDVGATVAVPADAGLAAVVRSLAADGADAALETGGTETARAACEACLAEGGRCLVAHDDLFASLDVGSLIPRLAALHAEGLLPLERLVAYFPFERVGEAFAAKAEGAVVKPIVRFSLGLFGDLDRALQEGAAQEEPRDEGGPEPEDAPTAPEREAPVTA